MLAVQYDHEMLTTIDETLKACSSMLRDAKKLSELGHEFNAVQVECLQDMRDQLGVWLGRYDRGYWVSPKVLARMRRFESQASQLVGHEQRAVDDSR
jgi:hypothetical protein